MVGVGRFFEALRFFTVFGRRQGGRLFKVSAYSRRGAYSNKYVTTIKSRFLKPALCVLYL